MIKTMSTLFVDLWLWEVRELSFVISNVFYISIKALDEDFPQVVFGFRGYNGNPCSVFMWD